MQEIQPKIWYSMLNYETTIDKCEAKGGSSLAFCDALRIRIREAAVAVTGVVIVAMFPLLLRLSLRLFEGSGWLHFGLAMKAWAFSNRTEPYAIHGCLPRLAYKEGRKQSGYTTVAFTFSRGTWGILPVLDAWASARANGGLGGGGGVKGYGSVCPEIASTKEILPRVAPCPC